MPFETPLNRYAALAEQFLRREFPARYQQLRDPASHFQVLAAQIDQRVETEQKRLAQERSADSYQQSRDLAEKAVCSDLSWLIPSPDPTDPTGRTDETGAYLGWTDSTLRPIRDPDPDLADWELAELDSGRDPTMGRPLLADQDITHPRRRSRQS